MIKKYNIYANLPLLLGTISSIYSIQSAAAPGYTWTSGDYTNSLNTTTTSSNESGIKSSGSTGTLINSGTISSTRTGAVWEWTTGAGIYNTGNIVAIINDTTGTFSSNQYDGITNNDGGHIGEIKNFGLIQGGSNTTHGIYNINLNGIGNSIIDTITNIGTITTGAAGSGIGNYGTISNLNNAQGVGNTSGALTYTGELPTNYNIIINSLTQYGQLNGSGITGRTVFGIYSNSTLTKGIYDSVLTGLAPGNIATTSGIFNGTAWSLILNSGTTWDLVVQSSAANTFKTVKLNGAGLAAMYNQQAAAYYTALSYDCQVYDENNLCVGVGGRYSHTGPSPTANAQAGLIVIGYRPIQTFRFGAFADQFINISSPSGFTQSQNTPMWGMFAKWNLNKDGTGLSIQASAVNSTSKLTVTRTLLTNTEAGSGSTQFDGQGYQISATYHQPLTDSTALISYLGLRYTRINTGSYRENMTPTVTSPLSYNSMIQNSYTAIGGLGISSPLAKRLSGTISVGVQQSLKYSMENYQGTSSITGLENFSYQMPRSKKSIATASLGLFYDIRKRERLSFNVLWQQQPFVTTNTTTALATYSIGF